MDVDPPQSAVVCDHCVRRIENTQSASRGKYEVFSIHGFAGTGQAAFPRNDGFADKVFSGKGSDSYEVHCVSLRSE